VTTPGEQERGPPILETRDLAVGYGSRAVVEGIDVALHPGDALGIVGPNGSGKTTFLKTVLGLLPPLRGSLRRGDGFRASYVPQTDSIDPVFPFRALDVVRMAARADAALPFTATAERERLAREALDRVGVGRLADRPYPELSGGQRQRVLLARALAARPTVLALDEPTTGLDLTAETALLDLVRRLREEEGITVLLVTHGLAAVANEATQVLLIHEGRHREGPVESVLVPEVLEPLYGIPVRVDVVGGRRLVTGLPGPRS
jgi:ABC-type Mn2+/Zn2+ transport system ATPase subunit